VFAKLRLQDASMSNLGTDLVAVYADPAARRLATTIATSRHGPTPFPIPLFHACSTALRGANLS
jgi:hypothetical protein